MSSLSEQLKPEMLARLGRFPIMAGNAVMGIMSGLHKSISKGSGGDFMQYSPCTPGDDLRYVDWKLYARQDRLYNKVRNDDTTMKCAIVVDGTASMAYKGSSSALSKYQYAAILGACFASVASSQNDNAGVFVLGASGIRRMPFAGRDDVFPLVNELDNIKPEGKSDILEYLHEIDDFLGHSRGLTFFLSDLIGCDLPSLIKHFVANSRELHLCHILDRDEVELPFGGTLQFQDAESNENIVAAPDLVRDAYKLKMEHWLGEVRNQALEGQSHYQFATSDASFWEYFC